MPPVPADVVRVALLVPLLAFFLCRTVEPAALGATALLGDRLDAPTLVALAAGPGMAEVMSGFLSLRRQTRRCFSLLQIGRAHV